MTLAVLVLAGGRGVRAGGGRPKQYHLLAGTPVLRRALECFVRHPLIDMVRVVIHPDDVELYRTAVDGIALLPSVFGGDERQLSAVAGLESLTDLAPSKVLIHDAARPFVSAGLIERVVCRLDDSPAVIPALAVADTLKRVATGRDAITGTVDRTGLWRAQTPQGFDFQAILAAHRHCDGVIHTDDAAVMEAAGSPVVVVEGDEDNMKLTTEADFARAETAIAARSTVRVGMGFDVHRFGPGDKVMLCGVAVPFEKGLEGHSDADVALHALTDALLGAVGAGDIGQHFPPTDARWKGAASRIFVEEAARLVRARGGRIDNVDVTVIGERPKVGPHREAMRRRIAELLALPETQVNIKATTTERLGFTGRGEGLAAQAVACIRLP